MSDQQSTCSRREATTELSISNAQLSFSIVTPSFQQGRYILDTLVSVKEQLSSFLVANQTVISKGGNVTPASPIRLEHLVIDAGSTDGTVEILKSWKEENLALGTLGFTDFSNYGFDFISEPDNGQTDAINKGLRKAKGDWLMWLNADDYLLPGTLKAVHDFIMRSPGADFVYGDCFFVDENRKILRLKSEGNFSWNMLLFYGCYVPSTSSFFHKRTVEAAGFLDDSLKVCMDYELFLRLAHHGFRFEHIPAPLACFRWHGSNVSSVYAQKRREEKLCLQRKYLAECCWIWRNEGVLFLMQRFYQGVRFSQRLFRRLRFLHGKESPLVRRY